MAKKFNNREDVLEYLNSLPLQQLINVAADAIMQNQSSPIQKIILTQEQFNSFFRIRGYNDNGEVETRGRKRLEQIEFPE